MKKQKKHITRVHDFEMINNKELQNLTYASKINDKHKKNDSLICKTVGQIDNFVKLDNSKTQFVTKNNDNNETINITEKKPKKKMKNGQNTTEDLYVIDNDDVTKNIFVIVKKNLVQDKIYGFINRHVNTNTPKKN